MRNDWIHWYKISFETRPFDNNSIADILSEQKRWQAHEARLKIIRNKIVEKKLHKKIKSKKSIEFKMFFFSKQRRSGKYERARFKIDESEVEKKKI